MLISHIPGLFSHPSQEWQRIKQEHTKPFGLYLGYVLVLAAIGPVCAYIATTRIGWYSAPGEVVRLTSSSGAQLCVLTYLAFLAGVGWLGYMVDWMAKTYGGEPDLVASKGLALAVYAGTPVFLAGFAHLVLGTTVVWNAIWIIALIYTIAAAYAGYLLNGGLMTMMEIPVERAFMFSGAVLTIALVGLVGALIGAVILWNVGFGPEYL